MKSKQIQRSGERNAASQSIVIGWLSLPSSPSRPSQCPPSLPGQCRTLPFQWLPLPLASRREDTLLPPTASILHPGIAAAIVVATVFVPNARHVVKVVHNHGAGVDLAHPEPVPTRIIIIVVLVVCILVLVLAGDWGKGRGREDGNDVNRHKRWCM